MTVPTVAMGFLPTYKQVGGWSTALLVICRLLQGFSVGGQLPSSLVYTLETKPKADWGYYGSFINMAANSGIIFMLVKKKMTSRSCWPQVLMAYTHLSKSLGAVLFILLKVNHPSIIMPTK